MGVVMGRKSFFTESEVFEAADRLAAEGKEVSATALLNALGGGSLTTIYKHLKAWQESRPAQMQTPHPIDLPEPVKTAFAAAWKVAMSESAKDLQAVREKAAEEVKTAQRQFAEALESIERLEKEAEAEANRIDGLTAKVAELEAALQKSETENAAVKATAEQLRHQVKSQEAELERVHKDMEAQRQRHQGETDKLKEAAQLAQDKAAKQMDELKAQLTDGQHLLQQAGRDRDDANKKAQEAQGYREKAEEKTLQLDAELKIARSEREQR